MVGISNYPAPGLVVHGKKGKYRLKKNIGGGGNGTVFLVDILESSEDSLPSKECVIKVFTINPSDENELKKRKARFVKEIQKVLSFQNSVDGIIPIYDSSILCVEEQDFLWYLMPKAEPYRFSTYDTPQKLTHMLQLGKCIKQLHDLGYAHRDIKPKNLLLYNNKLFLSDFGLIWNANDTDDHITEVNDRLGPQAIRPPELQMIEKLDSVDYRYSDVYLYAKTIWIVLKCNNSGFSSEYSKTNITVCLDKSELGIETAEPLHHLMSHATKDNYWERCTINDCLKYLEDQIRVINKNIPQDILNKWKYIEQIDHTMRFVTPDGIIYKKPSTIFQILNELTDVVELVFYDAGKEYCYLPLKKVNFIKNELFEIEIVNPYSNGRKKTIELSIADISIENEKTYIMHSKEYSFDSNKIAIFSNITSALDSPNRRVRLSASYLIKLASI